MNRRPAVKLPFSTEIATHQLYHGPIRAGRFGHLTAEPYTVWQFPDSELAFLHPFPTPDYSQAGYRESVNGSADVDEYFTLHDSAQPAYLALLQPLLRRGMVVADCGCGGGSLLDLLQGWAKTTVAIEPFGGFHASLAARGHEVHASVGAATAAGRASQVDLAISLHVIEHTEDPLAYLREIRALLRPGGQAFVLTPNLNDILLKLHPGEFAPFFFRVVHNLYFNARALRWAAEQAGFLVERSVHYHEFNLANTLHWLRDRRPRGNTALPGLEPGIDAAWRAYLEATGQANNVGVILRNPA